MKSMFNLKFRTDIKKNKAYIIYCSFFLYISLCVRACVRVWVCVCGGGVEKEVSKAAVEVFFKVFFI
jgi:hypothetical protein